MSVRELQDYTFVAKYSYDTREFHQMNDNDGSVAVAPFPGLAKLLNPAIPNVEGIIEKKIFSNEERKFIMNEIIPKFKLEKIIIENILQKIKNEHKVNTETLDEIITNTVIKWKTENEERARDEKIDEKNIKNLQTYRIATMGRLAEIDEVEWNIKDGKSEYLIST